MLINAKIICTVNDHVAKTSFEIEMNDRSIYENDKRFSFTYTLIIFSTNEKDEKVDILKQREVTLTETKTSKHMLSFSGYTYQFDESNNEVSLLTTKINI